MDELKYNIIKSLKRVRAPLLIIHGNLDENVTLSQGELLYKNANKPKKLCVLEGADHIFVGFEDKVMKETLMWFKKWLK